MDDYMKYPIAVEPKHYKTHHHHHHRGFGIDLDDIVLIAIIAMLLLQKEECDWGSLAGCVHLLMC